MVENISIHDTIGERNPKRFGKVSRQGARRRGFHHERRKAHGTGHWGLLSACTGGAPASIQSKTVAFCSLVNGGKP